MTENNTSDQRQQYKHLAADIGVALIVVLVVSLKGVIEPVRFLWRKILGR